MLLHRCPCVTNSSARTDRMNGARAQRHHLATPPPACSAGLMRAWPARDSRALLGSGEADGSLVVLVLNHELPACTPRLWRAAALRVAADGGANRLYDELPALLPHLSAEQARWRVAEVLAASRAVASRAPPRACRCASSSCRTSCWATSTARARRCWRSTRRGVRAWWTSPPSRRDRRQTLLRASHSCARRLTACAQDTNDLHKCVAFALAAPATAGAGGLSAASAERHVVALGALGGRLDHELAALSVLHAFPDARITLLGCHAAATLLPPGAHLLRPCPPQEGPVCGLVPLGASLRARCHPPAPSCVADTRASFLQPAPRWRRRAVFAGSSTPRASPWASWCAARDAGAASRQLTRRERR